MFFKNATKILITLFVLTLFENAIASSISVKCEVRSNTRSKVSVDGSGLVGTYYAVVYSPGSNLPAVKSRIPLTAVNGEVQFDFDSNPADIAAGATKISPVFIKNLTVYGYIRRVSDNQLSGAMKAICQAK